MSKTSGTLSDLCSVSFLFGYRFFYMAPKAKIIKEVGGEKAERGGGVKEENCGIENLYGPQSLKYLPFVIL